MRTFGYLVLALALVLPATAQAQVSRQGLLPADALHAYGLDRMWFTQVDVDRSRGKIVGLNQHVSSTKFHTVFEFIHAGRRYVVSERDRDAFGDMIGVEAAKLKAEGALATLKAELAAAGKPETETPTLETRVVPQITLAVSTNRGMLQLIDGETGKTLWSTLVGNPQHPTTEPAVSDEHVAVCNGSTLYVFKTEDGQLAWQKRVQGAIGAGPAITDELIYVPMINGTMETYTIADPRRARIFRAFGHTQVQPVASAQSVAWPTDQGKLYVGFARGGTMKYRVEATDAMTSPPTFLPPDKIIATSMDGYVYCIDEPRGQIIWRFTTGEPIGQMPLAVGETVYAVTDSGELYAIDAVNGTERWMTAGVYGLVAGNDKRLYATDSTGNLLILDAGSGSRLGSVPTAAPMLPFTNVHTDRIVMATRSGLIQCIRERDLVWPVLHQQFDGPARQKAKPKATPPAAGDGDKPAADPFAGPGEEDPFGGGAPAAPKPMADPFGGDDGADPFGGDDAADPFGGGEMQDDSKPGAEADPFG